MQKRMVVIFTVVAMASLNGCGSAPGERAASGAGIGAGAGAILGAVTGMTVVEGAVIGAAAGGLTGALTREDQINLGRPAWKQEQAVAAPARSSNQAYAGSNTVRELQSALRGLGYYSGPVDGVAGPKTSTAIRAYQKQNGLLVDGRPSVALLNHIRQRS
ncbi:MAG: peptidoglycan-binding domain-containing protein [Gammaproteobacteria bacterium]